MALIGGDIEKARQLLLQGKLVAIPTETVYGLAGNGLDETVVADIFMVKDRPSFDPMILHTSHLDKVKNLVKGISPKLRILAERFMPGPLSILLEKLDVIPDIVTAGSPKVAIRIPDHGLTLSLLEEISFPLAAPSANPFGYISPTEARHVNAQLGNKIDYILDGGRSKVGLESTIVTEEDGEVIVLRKGGIAIEEIETLIGKVVVKAHSTSRPAAPGMLASHYAPSIPVTFKNLDEILTEHKPEKIGLLLFQGNDDRIPTDNIFVMSSSGDLREAAFNLFAHMRALDSMDIDLIATQEVPDYGLGRAINDKLKRAAAN